MLGTLLSGRYKIISILGVGGFGRTFLVEDTQQTEPSLCVVKQFKPTSDDEKFLQVARRLFDKEVEILEKLGQHSQIPQFFGFFEENQEFYLVQEFIDGHPLSDEISPNRRFTEEEVIALLRDVLGILEFVHSQNVIHRDIKPGNLIRRHRDGKLVLIDFGAVKEIRTQLTTGTGQTSFTVGIGTQGYTPGEQLAGKPRFCSDIYALGMTAIQALTGLQPSHLPEDPVTSEPMWREHAHVSPGLAFILDRMVRSHFMQRYPTAGDVLQALQRLSELPTNITHIPPELLLPESLLKDQFEDETHLDLGLDWRNRLRRGWSVVAIATLIASSITLGIRQVGWIEPLELKLYDQMTRLYNSAPPDPRLLIVGITEGDLQTLQRSTPSDQDLATVISQLQQHNPRVIGLDLHRDVPQEPGNAALLQQLQADSADNIVAIMKLGDRDETHVPPPPGIPEERIGFNDFPIDPDNVVRRNLMFASMGEAVYYSFSLRTVLQYLAAEGIYPENSSLNSDYVELGESVLLPLTASSGGYQQADDAGYQILLHYRTAQPLAQQVSFTDVLNGQFDPEWVRDKVVLIGTVAASSKDLFYTPYTVGQQADFQMPGVIVHAQMVSQLLDVALNQTALFWFWPEWLEAIWIVGWSIAAGSLVWLVRHPIATSLGVGLMLGIIVGSGLALFTLNGWIPIAAPLIAAGLTGVVITSYRSYQMQRQQRSINHLLVQHSLPRNATHPQ